MSQEDQEDVKPKINLNITHNGTQITVKVKANMKFAKIFEAAEKRFEKESGTLRFTYDGNRIAREDTPASLGMDDGDIIDAFLGQVGGGRVDGIRAPQVPIRL